jgi:hypothetical protein
MNTSTTRTAAALLGVTAGVAGVVLGITIALSKHGSTASDTASPAGDAAGIAACNAITPQAAEYGPLNGLIRGETDTGLEIAAWQEQRNLPDVSGIVSPLRTDGLLSSSASVCVFSGDFVTPTGPAADDGTIPPPHDTITLIIEPDGSLLLDSSGYLARNGADTPAQWRARTTDK